MPVTDKSLRVSVTVVGDLLPGQVVSRLVRAAADEGYRAIGEPQCGEVRYRVADGQKLVTWWAAGYR